ncbi:hypothetical protein [Paenibacillus odorifer]|uniref:Uncharacterized protein n=1 Tax=Paenibacillus odorifer TaxID=189426 RepID=A0A1R0XQY3_9BACL|nr:hypothetical protein [Paenibacillus odorifer]OMD37531.1 hypothetical protein BSK52_21285 [Paenibacillus odorifer]
MNRKVLALIMVIVVITIVIFSFGRSDNGAKEKIAVVNVSDNTNNQKAVITDGAKGKEVLDLDGKELQPLKEEAAKENPLTEQQMIGIAQDQVNTYFSIYSADSKEEVKSISNKVFYYADRGFDVIVKHLEPYAYDNIQLNFTNEKVLKNGSVDFSYTAILDVDISDVKTKEIYKYKYEVFADFRKGTNGTYKLVSYDFAVMEEE